MMLYSMIRDSFLAFGNKSSTKNMHSCSLVELPMDEYELLSDFCEANMQA